MCYIHTESNRYQITSLNTNTGRNSGWPYQGVVVIDECKLSPWQKRRSAMCERRVPDVVHTSSNPAQPDSDVCCTERYRLYCGTAAYIRATRPHGVHQNINKVCQATTSSLGLVVSSVLSSPLSSSSSSSSIVDGDDTPNLRYLCVARRIQKGQGSWLINESLMLTTDKFRKLAHEIRHKRESPNASSGLPVYKNSSKRHSIHKHVATGRAGVFRP